MARKKFDVTVKDMVEAGPNDWLNLAGRAAAPAEVIDADLATVSSAADKVLRVKAADPYLFHMEFAAGHDGAKLPAMLNARNALLEARHDLPVRSVAILLKPEADSPKITGKYERKVKGEKPYRVFRYDVVKVWKLDVEQLLTGGIGTVPLAPVAAVEAAALPKVLERVEKRFEEESGQAGEKLWMATSILMGLRYDEAFIEMLIQGVQSMEVKSVLHDMLDRERAAGLRIAIVAAGEDDLGLPSDAVLKRLEAIKGEKRLAAIARKVKRAKSWEDLFSDDPPAAPAPRRPRRPKGGKES